MGIGKSSLHLNCNVGGEHVLWGKKTWESDGGLVLEIKKTSGASDNG